MVSTRLKVNKFSMKHLAKTFYFVLSFLFYLFCYKARSKRFGRLGLKAINFRLSTKTLLTKALLAVVFILSIDFQLSMFSLFHLLLPYLFCFGIVIFQFYRKFVLHLIHFFQVLMTKMELMNSELNLLQGPLKSTIEA